jgi:hypothetical protein
MSTSGVLPCLRMETVSRSRWGPSSGRANIPRYLTAYVNLDDYSGRITTPPVSEWSVGWPRSHGKIKDHSRHHARQGTHIDRKNQVGNEAQHFRTIFSKKDWDKEYADMKIQQVVLLYLNDDEISRSPAPPIVSPCKGIISCFSFMFLGVPRHYVRRSFSCSCTSCYRVCGRGHGSKSCGPNLMVQDDDEF